MEITEAMNASPGTGPNSEYLCICFCRNMAAFLNTWNTQLWFKHYFDFSCLPKSLKGTCHLVGKELTNFTFQDYFIYKPWRTKNSCVGRGEWPFYPGPAFDSCDFMSCAKTRKWADQISHAVSAVILPQGSNYCLRVCYNTENASNLKSLCTASSDSHKPARDLSLLEGAGRNVLPRTWGARDSSATQNPTCRVTATTSQQAEASPEWWPAHHTLFKKLFNNSGEVSGWKIMACCWADDRARAGAGTQRQLCCLSFSPIAL